MTDEEVREWAQGNADMTRGRLPEWEVWQHIAEHGREWNAARLARRMTPQRCFSNAARTVLGETKFDASGCQYAEGFALTSLGMWSHHAWVVTPAGLVVERTWPYCSGRYVGVTVEALGGYRPAGWCQLSDDSCGFAWAPGMTPEQANRLFDAERTSSHGKILENKPNG